MGAGEARSGGSEKLSLLADGFEAVVAAVYLDGGLTAAETFVRRIFMPDVSGIDVGDLSFHDYKTALQESAQGLGLPLPEYRVVDEYGPDHEKSFVVEVYLGRGILRLREGILQARGPTKSSQGSVEEARKAASVTSPPLARDLRLTAHRRAARPDAGSTARLIPRCASAPASRTSSLP